MDSSSTNPNPQSNEDDEQNEDDEEEAQPASNQLNSTTALIFNALQQTLNNKNGQRNGWQQQKSANQVASKQGGLNGGAAKATTCPECGKHVRKRKLHVENKF